MRNLGAVLACAVCLGTLLLDPAAPHRGPSSAQASVSIALSLDELVSVSTCAVVAQATERRSAWEKVAGSQRIVTYTKLEVTRSIFGSQQKELWVRTLGGVVGKIGQHVSGEAQIVPGSSSVLFLTPSPEGPLMVTGRAQGHFPIVKPKKAKPKLQLSPDRGEVWDRRGPSIPAYTVLVGREVSAAVETIRKSWERLRAPK